MIFHFLTGQRILVFLSVFQLVAQKETDCCQLRCIYRLRLLGVPLVCFRKCGRFHEPKLKPRNQPSFGLEWHGTEAEFQREGLTKVYCGFGWSVTSC